MVGGRREDKSRACRVCVRRGCRMHIVHGEVQGLMERVAFLRDLRCHLLRSGRKVSMY